MKNYRSIVFALMLLCASTASSQDKWFVNKGTTGTQTGKTWADAFHDLQPAITAASSGDSIFVAKGIYYPTSIQGAGNDPRDKAFLIKNGILIYGGFVGTELFLDERNPIDIHTVNLTVLSGDLGMPGDSTDNCYHVVVAVNNSSLTVLDGLNIYGGNADTATSNVINSVSLGRNFGGGITTVNSTLLVNNCQVFLNLALSGGAGMNNKTGSALKVENSTFTSNKIWGTDPNNFGGGGMRNDNCSPTITNVFFYSNSVYNAQGGGAMRNENSNPIISASQFSINETYIGDGGAGIYNIGSNPVLSDVLFFNNYTLNQGGGMYNDNSIAQLNEVYFLDNLAEDGGGAMENDGGSHVVLKYSSFFGNETYADGGAIQNWKSSPVLEDVLFLDNYAGQDGGAMFNYTDCSPKVTNTIFDGNTADRNGGAIYNRRNSNPILTNILVTNNSAGSLGGGIYSASSNSSPCSPIVTNGTITKNYADSSGGGAFDDGAGNSKLRNSIVSGNTSNGEADVDAPQAMAATALFRVVIGTDYYVTGLVPPTVVSGNIFIDPVNDDFELIAGSPAIDKGDSSFYNTGQTPDLSAITTDLRYAKRTMGVNTDLGALEVCGDTVATEVSISGPPGNVAVNGTSVTFTALYKGGGSNPVFNWFVNGSSIANTGSTFTGIAGTDFANGDVISVSLHSSGPCNDPNSDSSYVELTVTTGISTSDSNSPRFLIYPNPASGIITVEGSFRSNASYEVNVSNLLGTKVLARKFTGVSDKYRMDLAGLPRGIYLVSVFEDRNPVNSIRLIVK